MLNNTEKEYINHLVEFLPERRAGKRGPKPVGKGTLVTQLYKKFKHGLRWRDLEHATVCHNYFSELQRRGEFKNYLNFQTKKFKKVRQAKTIVDSSDMESYKTNNLVAYSGKYHNDCIKMTIEITPEYIPINFCLSKGTEPDSKVIDEMLIHNQKLPYELFLDKGYEKYERRRDLKKQNCQVRLEMKKIDKSRKKGPRFVFTQEHRKLRGEIEKVYSWLKSFVEIKFNRLKKKSLIMAKFIFCLSYIAFTQLKKL